MPRLVQIFGIIHCMLMITILKDIISQNIYLLIVIRFDCLQAESPKKVTGTATQIRHKQMSFYFYQEINIIYIYFGLGLIYLQLKYEF